MHRPRLVTLVLLAALGLATGCGGDGGSDDGEAVAKQPAGDVEQQLGFSDDGILARQSRVEASLSACMKNEGFDYVPVDPVAQRSAVFGSSRMSEEDFIAQFGYGISTAWGRGGATADPNEQIRTGLGAADRRAYERALWGEGAGTTFASAVDTGDFSDLGGCTKKATEEVFGGARVLTQLVNRLDQMEERLLQDQRMVRAVESWSECMAQAGYRYEEPEEIDEDLKERMEELVGKLPGQFATGPAAGESRPSYDRAALARLQREEVQTAVADHSCERKTIEPVEKKVSPRYQQEFRAANAALISQVKPVR